MVQVSLKMSEILLIAETIEDSLNKKSPYLLRQYLDLMKKFLKIKGFNIVSRTILKGIYSKIEKMVGK